MQDNTHDAVWLEGRWRCPYCQTEVEDGMCHMKLCGWEPGTKPCELCGRFNCRFRFGCEGGQ